MSNIYFRLFANTTKIRSCGHSKTEINCEINRISNNLKYLINSIPYKENYIGNTITFTIQIVKQTKTNKIILKQFSLPFLINICRYKININYILIKFDTTNNIEKYFNWGFDQGFFSMILNPIKTERNIPVVSNKNKLFQFDKPLITVENYSKWYNLYIYDNKELYKLDDYLEKNNLSYEGDIDPINHSFNPKEVITFAKEMGLYVGLAAYKAIVINYVVQKQAYVDEVNGHILDEDELPTKEDLLQVIRDDYGSYINTIDCLYETSLDIKKPEFRFYL